jgi:elongator complex protein 2
MGKVNAVKFLPTQGASQIIISGSVDKTIRIWQRDEASPTGFYGAAVLTSHEGSINVIAVHPGSNIFASGSADATVRIWRMDLSEQSTFEVELLQTINITPRFFPLAVALSSLPASPGSFILAVAGTKNIIQIYVASAVDEGLLFKLQAGLVGHEGWIRALEFTYESDSQSPDILLASASQDKYIRLWRIHEGEDLPPAIAAGSDPALGTAAKSLSNKAHRFDASGVKHSVTFEALLLGHEDWIYTASWRPNSIGKAQLLTASADSSIAVWEPDASSGIWVCVARLGEISTTKGSTTATGSTGGFWVGLWSPTGETLVSLGRTGSWRLWNYDRQQDLWLQGVAISGHVKEVAGISWAKNGEYLLSTG